MAQAEIKTKLTADGSELSRALNRGIQQATDFRKNAMDLGKALGRAFTFSVVVRGVKEAIKQFDELQAKQREIYEESVKAQRASAERREATEKVKDTEAARSNVKKIQRELEDLILRRDRLLDPTIGESLGDLLEGAFTGSATARDEEIAAVTRLITKIQSDLQDAKRRAKEVGMEEEKQKKQDAARDELDFLDKIRRAEEEVNKQSAENLDIEQKKADAVRARADAELEAQFGAQSNIATLLEGFTQKTDQRFSDLRRMGANELGSGRIKEDSRQTAERLAGNIQNKIKEVADAVKNDLPRALSMLQGIF